MPRRDRDEGYERDIVRQFAGRAGNDPERRDVGDDQEIVTFSLAVTRLYPDRDTKGDDGETRWYSVSTGKPELMDWVEDNIHKGSAVCVEGFPSTKESGDRTYYNLRAARIGLVTWGGASAARSTKAKTTKRTNDEDDW